MKDIPEQEVVRHLERQNPWWSEGVDGDGEAAVLRPRDYLDPVYELLAQTSVRRALVLLGPRRVGKTILIRHLIRRLLQSGHPPDRVGYVDVGHPLLTGQTLETLAQLLQRNGNVAATTPRYLFFDEVQYLRGWQDYLKALVDTRPDLRILVSGSAAAALSRQSRESGAGRFTDFLLPPLTFSEYLNLGAHRGAIEEEGEGRYRVPDLGRLNQLFVEYVNFGGYPELALQEAVRRNTERFIKSDIVDKVLLRDLPTLYGIQDIQELNYLFSTLAYNTAEEVSLESLSKKSGVGKPTIQRYIEYLEAAFLVRRLYRVDQSGRRFQRERAFKIYLTNPAMRTGLYGESGADTEGFGHLVETAVFAQYLHENARLHYARWREAEVDLVELAASLEPVSVLETKWSDAHVDDLRRLTGVLTFCDNNAIRRALVTTRSASASRKAGKLELVFVPASVVCHHIGLQSVRGRVASLQLPTVSV